MSDRISERNLAVEIGVPRRNLAELRKALEEGVHWFKEGRVVYWTKNGAQEATAAAGGNQTDAVMVSSRVDEKTPTEGDSDEIVEAMVSGKTKNARIMLATLEKNAERVRVRVRDQGKFPLGFKIPLIRIKEIPGLFRLARKEPRWMGRW